MMVVSDTSAGVSQTMSDMHIDHSVYPDVDVVPTVLESMEEKADYVHRICSAWDYGVHPDSETFQLFAQWKEVFDRFPVLTSPAYHAFRGWFGWPALPFPTGVVPPTPRWVHLDRLEGREEDPCEHMI
jgi:hypothetical protein